MPEMLLQAVSPAPGLVLPGQEHHSPLGSQGGLALCAVARAAAKPPTGQKGPEALKESLGSSSSHEFGIRLPMLLRYSFCTYSKKNHIACVRSQACSSRGHRLARGCKLQLPALSLQC